MKGVRTLAPRPIALGPSAALEAELTWAFHSREDPAEKAAIMTELVRLRLRAFRDPVPEEDAEWAHRHREREERSDDMQRRSWAGRWACEGYLESTNGTFEGRAAQWDSFDIDREPWYEFGDRVRKAPAGESEEATLDAALAAYGSRTRQPTPTPSAHWLAAARAVREKMATRKPAFQAVPVESVKGLMAPPGTRERLRELRMKRPEVKIRPIAPGPSAAREAELATKLSWVEDPAEKEALLAEHLALIEQAQQDPIPEEDAEWARIHREWDQDWLREFRPARRDIAAKLAYRAYCETEGIPVDENALATRRLPDAFYWVGDRMIDRPGEPEHETLAAALAVYAACTRKEPPRPSDHWLAAIRKVREILPKPKEP